MKPRGPGVAPWWGDRDRGVRRRRPAGRPVSDRRAGGRRASCSGATAVACTRACIACSAANRDMDDLLQEAFLQVFQSLRGWRAEASLATWIDRVAVRVAYRYLSQRGRRDQTDALDDDDVLEPSAVPTAATARRAPPARARRRAAAVRGARRARRRRRGSRSRCTRSTAARSPRSRSSSARR